MKSSHIIIIILLLIALCGYGASQYSWSPTPDDDPYLGDGGHSATLTMHANNNFNGSVDVKFYINNILVGMGEDLPIGRSAYKTYES